MRALHTQKKIIAALLVFSFVLVPLAVARGAPSVIPVIETPFSPLLLATLALSASTQAKNTGTAPIDWFDRIAFLLARAAIRTLTASIVQWINTGFQGSPAFVTDIQGYFADVADQALGEFVYGSELGFMCSPFQLSVRIALLQQFAKKQKPLCRLSDISKNINRFLAGNFYDGGWKGWITLWTDPYGNPYSSFINSSFEFQARVLTAQGAKGKELDFGRGLLSLTECTTVDRDSGQVLSRDYGLEGTKDGEATDLVGNNAEQRQAAQGASPSRAKTNCSIVTPGAAIENQLADVMGSGLRQLELSNSLNQILDALVSQLIKQVFLSAGGLAGVSKSTYNNSPFIQSYAASSNVQGVSETKDGLASSVNQAIDSERKYKKAKEESLASVTATGAPLKELTACYADKLSLSSGLYGEQRKTAQERFDTASSTIKGKIDPSVSEYNDQIRSANTNIIVLDSLLESVAKVKSEFDLAGPAKEFLGLQTSGRLHASYSVFEAEQTRDAVKAEMDALAEQTKKDIEACKVYPNLPQS